MHLKGTSWDHLQGYGCIVAAPETCEARTGIRVERTKRSPQACAARRGEKYLCTAKALALEAETDLIVRKCDAAVSLMEAGKANCDALSARTFPLEQAGGALELMASGEAYGKIILLGEPGQH